VGGLALAAGLAGLLWLRTPSFTRELPGLYMARAHPGEAGVELVDVHGPCRAAGFPGHRPCDGATTDLRYRLDPQSNLRFMSIWAADGTHALSQFGPLEPTATGGVERCERGLCPLPNAVRAVLQGVRRAQVVLSEEPAGSRSLRELNAATGLVTFSFEFTEIK
jgi:hypothetical protein